MKNFKILLLFALILPLGSMAQKSEIYTHELVEYNRAVQLYQNKNYSASKEIFERIKDDFDQASELKARSYYFEAFCAIRLGQKNGDDLMNEFFTQFPTSTKRNSAFLEVGEYYFNNRRYAYALKWFSKVKETSLTRYNQEEFRFKKAYALFAVGSFSQSKSYFSQLLNSQKYGAQAKYYYGYMAYQEDDYSEADKYLNQVAGNPGLDDDIPYYMANIKFKTGKFEEAIETAKPLLEKSNGIQHSELSKIIGESYFNLEDYEQAVNYLLDYKGKKGKWNNTDFYQLGYAYYKQQLYDDALIWFTKIIDGNNAVSQNAYYHMGECYLKTDKKQEALNAFRNAKQMDFNAEIKKDAWLNYAKLSYDIGNPYNSVAQVIKDYINAYPEEIDQEEIKEYLISAYLGARDFEGALNYLKENEDDNAETYQKVAFLHATQWYQRENFERAAHFYDESYRSDAQTNFKLKALFWKAESLYKQEKYNEALALFNTFKEESSEAAIPEKNMLDYHMAYTYFQLKDYSTAGGHFNQFINESDDQSLLVDSHLRLGDCFFALSSYFKAIPAYEKVVEANDVDVDYAQLQIAFCYGYSGDNDKKIQALNDFTQYHLKSTLRDDAYYELGNTYVKINRVDEALTSYDEVINGYPMSSLVPKSMLKKGLIFFNADRNNEGLSLFREVVQKYPGTDEAKEAVANAKQIYIQEGRVDEYERFVKQVDFIDVSDNEIETSMFASAEQQYINGKFDKSVEAFQKYLDRFPNGPNAVQVNYLLADSYSKLNQEEKALPYYKKLLDSEKNQYTEQALVKVATGELEAENWDAAILLLERLEEGAESEHYLTFARQNLMKGYYGQQNYDKAVTYAETVLQQQKLDPKIASDARVIVARSAFFSGDMYKAQETFSEIEKTATGEIKAEAVYYDAYFKNSEGNYKLSNVSVQKLATDHANHQYWGAKGLIIMAKNFYALEDAYQATYILESVIQKFSSYDDVSEEARNELNKIKSQEAKTNSSVIIDNNE